MSELIKNVETIPLTAQIPVTLSGGYYARLHQLMMYLATQRTPEEFQKALLSLQNKKESDKLGIYEYHLETILSLIYELEHQARENKQTKNEDLDPSKLSNSI